MANHDAKHNMPEEYHDMKQRHRYRVVGALVSAVLAALLLWSVRYQSQKVTEPLRIKGSLSEAGKASVVPSFEGLADGTADDARDGSSGGSQEGSSGGLTDDKAAADALSVSGEPILFEPEPAPPVTSMPALKPQVKNQAKAPDKSQAKAKSLSANDILNNKAAHRANNPGGVRLQIGAYASEAQAQSVVKKLQTLGVPAQISRVKVNGKVLFRVRTVQVVPQAKLKTLQQKLKAAGLESLIVRP